MTRCSELADIEWLTGSEAGAILAELSGDNGPLHATVARLRRTISPERTHLLVEQVDLRRRAAAKFSRPELMYFTRIGLEQATDEWTAAYKASRFNAPTNIADLCCGIGGDLLALSRRAGSVSARSAIGIDLDPTSAHFAAINTGAPVHQIDVTAFDFSGIDAWHIDPDRRSTGHRTTKLDYYQPNVETIEQLLARSPNAAIKLAPATKVPANWEDRCELEWISRDRECKQLVAWHGSLVTEPSIRRATVLSSASDLAPRTITGAPHQSISITHSPDRFVFDVDPAVTAARLTGALAAEHNLAALAAGPTYLTGPIAINDPALSCFEVDELLTLEIRKLSQHLRTLGIGQLEIKKRGIDLDPEKLRRDLKLRGPNAATLLITQIASRPTVIRAHRVASPPTP
jgi:hypothetical protein